MTNNSKALEESVRTIFCLPQIVNIERQVLDLYRRMDHSRGDRRSDKNRIRQLLMERKKMLDNEFVMDVGYQQLLSEFNDALRQQLITMHEKILKTYHALRSTKIAGDLSVVGKCFLCYDYSKIHPVQTIRCKKIWYMLNGTLDYFNERYDDGVYGLGGWHYDASYDDAESLDNLLYLNADDRNWDDWFKDEPLTVDMQIVYPVHSLLEYTAFSIFDILWVRDFNIELWTELDYGTDNCRDEEDLDFDLLDY